MDSLPDSLAPLPDTLANELTASHIRPSAPHEDEVDEDFQTSEAAPAESALESEPAAPSFVPAANETPQATVTAPVNPVYFADPVPVAAPVAAPVAPVVPVAAPKPAEKKDTKAQPSAQSSPCPSQCSSLSRLVPPNVLAIVHYEKPVRSAIVFGAAFFLYFAFIADSAFPWIYTAAHLTKLVLLPALVVNLANHLHATYIRKVPVEALFVEALLWPKVQPYLAEVASLLPAREKIVHSLDVFLQHLPLLSNWFLSLVFCRSFRKTAQVVVLAILTQAISLWFTLSSLIFFGLITAATVPFVFRKYQRQIDDKIALAHGHLTRLIARVPIPQALLKKSQ
eukprot:m.70216 g.70216  ORF g.70216 m.70216 type:complete len:339 (+) comp50117_c1_seq1:2845-3861(+)